jgi:hypothetical protein
MNFYKMLFLTVLIMCSGNMFGTERLLSKNSSAMLKVIAKKHSVWQQTIKFSQKGRYKLNYRLSFNYEPSKSRSFVCLALTKPVAVSNLQLNGQTVPLPLSGMIYKRITNIPISMLKVGENILTGNLTMNVRGRKRKGRVQLRPEQLTGESIAVALYGMELDDFAFDHAPILGWAGTDFFTVSNRTNMSGKVTLKLNGKDYQTSDSGMLHKFKVIGLKPNTVYSYSLTAEKAGHKISSKIFQLKTYPKNGLFSFVALGDSRSQPDEWRKVAAAVVKQQPLFVLFDGDMVQNGQYNYQWLEQLFKPAPQFFATIPQYVAIGNHEREDRLFYQIFQRPQNPYRWSQQIGEVLIIIINGTRDWKSGSENMQWLEEQLRHSKAKFIFLCSHYPAWSLGTHTRLNKDGRAREETVYYARKYIMPLLKKYRATAMFAGHDHFYERSAPSNGVTMILTGGAGAPIRKKYNPGNLNSEQLEQFWQKQNPYSKVWVGKYHFCLITVDGDHCTMQAITPAGEVIDSITWQAREIK